VSVGTVTENVEEILDKLKKSGTRIYLSPVLPVADSFTKKINPKIDELNRAYLKLAKEAKVEVIDFRADMRNSDGFLKDEFSRDGIHLTAEGYRVWRDAIMPKVQQNCAARPAPQRMIGTPKPSRIDNTPAASPPAATIPAATTPASAAPAGEFNTRFGPWR
jgi:hypothetical protein